MWLRRFLYLAGAVTALAMSCALPATANQGWPSPVDGSRLLGFGATYQAADGSTNVHGGLDIAGSPGARIYACTAGEVVFAGKVPAGEDAQAFAVTLLTGDGLRVTLLPLSSAAVSAGSRVDVGDAVGVLAPSGDASSGSAHLHLGVKRGSTRLDPASFLAVDTPAPSASAPAVSNGPAVVPRPSGTHAAAGTHSIAGSALAPAPAASPVPESASAPSASVRRAPTSAREVLASASGAVATAVDAVPRLRRIPGLKPVRTLSVSRMWQDITDLRGALGKGVLAIVLVLVGAGCLVAVARTAATGAQRATAALAPVREERS